ncbi:MAG TPA: PEP-CTERM sorting domain-containing protein [Oscillatoriales cyanobacterium M59_W2019_021]|nr:PEP-CTERM sorting domain-containing protein [Oscillatoriales cyanobacterium M4454_W2019_049]HIK51765.1 PEP-CTERM sorting domain-containing protein [Oscillatoriales cyanobacterium M59_W2019_021]
MASFQKLSIALVVSIAAGSLIPHAASAATLTSTAVGSTDLVPITDPDRQYLNNGDFLLQRMNPGRGDLGDGRNEKTWWDFDFSDTLSSITDTLSSAFLSLTLTPAFGSDNDGVRIRGNNYGFDFITEPFANLTSGQEETVEINLFDYYSPTQIISYFNDKGGRFRMEYLDDSLVSRAELTLGVPDVARSVPEPATILGVLAVGGALGTLKRRQNREA